MGIHGDDGGKEREAIALPALGPTDISVFGEYLEQGPSNIVLIFVVALIFYRAKKKFVANMYIRLPFLFSFQSNITVPMHERNLWLVPPQSTS